MDAMTGTKESKNVENIHFPKSLASASLAGKYYVDVQCLVVVVPRDPTDPSATGNCPDWPDINTSR